MNVTDLPGIGPATSEKLASAGFDSILAIAVAPVSSLVDASGMTEATARKVIKAAREAMGMGFMTAENKEKEDETKIFRLSTGSKAVDDILSGGVLSGCITEVYGQFGSSKTQVALQLAVIACEQFPDGEVLYIDTENSFRPIRIRQMCSRFKKIDAEDVLKRIKLAKAYSSDHQIFLSEQAEALVKDGKVKLIVVDSVMNHFRAEYTGRGQLAERQQKLNRHLHTLSKIADLYNVPVFITNQVSANPGAMFGDPTQSIGGNIMGHSSKYRIYLRRGKAGSRVAKLLDAPELPDAEASFVITEKGVEDVE